MFEPLMGGNPLWNMDFHDGHHTRDFAPEPHCSIQFDRPGPAGSAPQLTCHETVPFIFHSGHYFSNGGGLGKGLGPVRESQKPLFSALTEKANSPCEKRNWGNPFTNLAQADEVNLLVSIGKPIQ